MRVFAAFIVPAFFTGLFCSGFAVGVDFLLPPLMGAEVAVIAGISGFLGSLFANLVLRRRG